MKVTARRYANAVVLLANGRLDQDTCDDFKVELTARVDDSIGASGALILDLSGLEYVSSAGLRCFMLASRQAKARKSSILVAQMQPLVAEIFEISHFDLMFRIFPTVREALAAVSGEAVAAFEAG